MLLVMPSQAAAGQGRGDPLGQALAQPELDDVVLAEPGVGQLVLDVDGAAGLVELDDAGGVVGAGVAAAARGGASRMMTAASPGMS